MKAGRIKLLPCLCGRRVRLRRELKAHWFVQHSDVDHMVDVWGSSPDIASRRWNALVSGKWSRKHG